MSEEKEIILEDCPICRGPGNMIHEGGWCCYVECLDCGAQTAFVEYKDSESRDTAERQVATLWNMGKVVKQHPGE